MAFKDLETKRAYDRQYYLKNRDKIKRRTKAYAEDHQEQVRQRKKASRLENHDRILAKQTRHREENREPINARARERYADNPSSRLQSNRHWRAKNTEHLKQYHKQYRLLYRDEKREKDRQYREQHREQLRAKQRERHHEKYHKRHKAYRLTKQQYLKRWMRQYRLANPDLFALYKSERKARQLSAARNDLTLAQWREIKAHYGNRCVYCDRTSPRLTMDHIIPLSKGGTHTASNVVPACSTCNSQKFTGPPLKPVQPMLLTVAKARKQKS